MYLLKDLMQIQFYILQEQWIISIYLDNLGGLVEAFKNQKLSF